ncbi:hypothetical protein G5B40_04050 [Pikeienuella piscinae]|uniref:Histidine phosphotransferase ChpT C-terminal domain-containing protein n=1 Tax=Pikeienuella piscinae TaxID=2748098 RepID=A0A7L5BXR8_9RHOB|nr:histidine phosphotransferase family protein [Pikeienuella piscinae]QIE54684.1 hypothetical protein G5B40_04050 [Pikeienuella piscinae]
MDDLQLSSLVSSRICHDLISPVGAIGNGLDLVRTAGGGEEEMNLIADCAEAAAAALRFLRTAFGARDPAESISVEELAAAAEGHLARRKIRLDWGDARGTMRFRAARPLLLLALVGAGALPRGGLMRLSVAEAEPLAIEWRLSGGPVKLQDRARALLRQRPDPAETAPGDVHFLLLWLAAEGSGARPYFREDGAVGVA